MPKRKSLPRDAAIAGDGYEILEAENGRQAVAILQSATDIDLLLLDIMMPEMDGFEVLAMMNKYPSPSISVRMARFIAESSAIMIFSLSLMTSPIITSGANAR